MGKRQRRREREAGKRKEPQESRMDFLRRTIPVSGQWKHPLR